MGVTFLLVGLSIMAVVMLIAMYRKHFRNRDEVVKTKAYVVENRSKMGANHVLYHPVIQFETEDGTLHRYMSSIGTVPPRVRTGTYVTLYYVKHNPRKYQIKAGAVMYVLSFSALTVGFIIAFVGLLISLA